MKNQQLYLNEKDREYNVLLSWLKDAARDVDEYQAEIKALRQRLESLEEDKRWRRSFKENLKLREVNR